MPGMMSVAGKALQQMVVQHQAAGAATHQTTAAAIELYATGMQQMLHVKAGHHQAQKQGTGDYPRKMR